MNFRKLLTISQYLITMLLLASTSINALFMDDETEGTINIESNSGAIIDFKKKIADYFGEVKITYGKSHLHADKVRIYQDDKKISRIIGSSEGTPVFLTLIENNKLLPTIICQGDKIDCDVITKTLSIEGNATIDYNHNNINSDTICYDHKQKIISAKPNTTNINSGKGKVHITINNPNITPVKKN